MIGFQKTTVETIVSIYKFEVKFRDRKILINYDSELYQQDIETVKLLPIDN